MPRSHSADIPRYDTYPAPTPSEAASTPQDWPYEPKTDVDARTIGNPRLNETAERIGDTLGRVVNIARTARRRAENVASGSGEVAGGLKERVNEFGEQARARMEDLRGRVETQISDAREAARARLDEARSIARERLDDARWRARVRAQQARRYAHDNPLQIIAGAALAGLAVGVGLRLWRSHHE